MKINTRKLNILLAEKSKDLCDLRGNGICYQTLLNIIKGKEAKTSSIGKLAKALGVKVEELLEDE